MRNPPQSVKDLWPKPNYENPERRGPGLIITQVILLTISTAFLLMRVYARVWITRARIGIDDILIILSYLCSIVLTALIIVAVQKYGWETHIWDLDVRNPTVLIMTRKISWISMIFYLCTSTFTKMSLLVFYLRILVAKVDKIITKATLAGVIAYFIAATVVLFTQCKPFGHYWETLTNKPGSCINEGVHMAASATINLVLDIIIFVIPLRSLLILKIRTSQKIQVIGLFTCGIAVVMAAVIRLYFVVMVFFETYDVTWYGYMTWLFACAESWIGLICACVPSCRAFFVSWNRGSLGSGNRSRTMSHGYGPGTNITVSRRRSYGDEDVRGLTTHSSNQGIGNQTKIKGGGHDSVSVSSEEYALEHKGIQALGGVRVQMEVMQYEEYDHGQRTPTSPRAAHVCGPTARR